MGVMDEAEAGLKKQMRETKKVRENTSPIS